MPIYIEDIHKLGGEHDIISGVNEGILGSKYRTLFDALAGSWKCITIVK